MAITIDTEVDKSHDWSNPEFDTYNSVLKGIPQLLTPLFERFGAKPTYLLSSEVMEQPECVEVLKATPNCELGTHLHGDLVEPNRSIIDMRNKRIKEMQCSYSKKVEGEKLSNLTNLYRRTFGQMPKAFRAGRFGAGNNTIPLLEELDYLVDSSVTPYTLWDYKEGWADFRNSSDQPYYPSYDEITKRGSTKVLEVPVSIVPLFSYKLLNQIRNRINGSLRSIPYWFYCIWMSPSISDYYRMWYGINKIIGNNGHSEAVVVNMMFHSMEVIPGASPAAGTKEEAKVILRRIENVLNLGKKKGFEFVTLSDTVPYFAKNE